MNQPRLIEAQLWYGTGRQGFVDIEPYSDDEIEQLMNQAPMLPAMETENQDLKDVNAVNPLETELP